MLNIEIPEHLERLLKHRSIRRSWQFSRYRQMWLTPNQVMAYLQHPGNKERVVCTISNENLYNPLDKTPILIEFDSDKHTYKWLREQLEVSTHWWFT